MGSARRPPAPNGTPSIRQGISMDSDPDIGTDIDAVPACDPTIGATTIGTRTVLDAASVRG
ncbi:MAG: hypothetical protein AB7P21_08715 [Lautropia sp.]